MFPQTLVQTCIVHLIRNSLAFVSWKDRKAIMPSLKAIYRAEAADIALTRLEEFEAVWGQALPCDRPDLAKGLRTGGAFFRLCPEHPKNDLHHELRRGADRSLRKIIKTRGSFPN